MRPSLVLLGVACYVVAQELLKFYVQPILLDRDCGGTPCWGSATRLLPQAVLMPGLTVTALYSHGSLRNWCDACHSSGLRGPALLAMYIFHAFMVVDMVWGYMYPGTMRLLMVIHHVVCILGNAYACSYCPHASRPCFLCAITCLELGSWTANVFWLVEPVHGGSYATAGALVYAVGMSVLHVLVLVLTQLWNARARDAGQHWLLRWPPMAVWAVLICMRQREMHMVLARKGHAWAAIPSAADMADVRGATAAGIGLTLVLASGLQWYWHRGKA